VRKRSKKKKTEYISIYIGTGIIFGVYHRYSILNAQNARNVCDLNLIIIENI